MHKFEIEWKGEIYDSEWYDDTNFEELKEVTSTSGFIFDDYERLCIVKLSKSDVWTLPGGHVELYDKNFEDAFRREVDEEADLNLKDIQRIGYFKSEQRGIPEDKSIQLRFVARVKKIKKQTIDPAEGEILKRKFIDPAEFNKYCKWGENGEFQLKKALDKLKIKKGD